MLRAVSVGAVVLGDKEKAELTEELNNTHTIDVAELGGDTKNNRNALYEPKTPTATKTLWAAGHGSDDLGGAPASTGHLVGFGNTDEPYRVKVLGTKQRGQPTDPPMDHAAGKGYVREHKGQYYDAFLARQEGARYRLPPRGRLGRHLPPRHQVDQPPARARQRGARQHAVRREQHRD